MENDSGEGRGMEGRGDFKAIMFTLSWIAFEPARKPHRVGLLFTHENGDLGEISVTGRSCAAPSRRVRT